MNRYIYIYNVIALVGSFIASTISFNSYGSDWTYDPQAKTLTDGTFGFTANIIDGTTNKLNVADNIASYSNDTHQCGLDLKNGIISDTDGNTYKISKWGVNLKNADITSVWLPSSITEITGTFKSCFDITDFNFTSEYVLSVPVDFMY